VLRSRLLVGFASLTAAASLSGCATPGYNPSRLESQLEHAGATPTQARCVTEGMSTRFDRTQLGSHSAPSLLRPVKKPTDPPGTKYENEYETTRDILKGCKVTLALNPLPS
jgi:hypothetical protein